MKKLLLSFMIVISLMTSLNAFSSSSAYQCNIFKSNETAAAGTYTVNTLVFNRQKYLIKNQNVTDMRENLEKRYCVDNTLNNKIGNFVYLYKDGILVITVDCK